jgi:hypothetical protein
MHHRHHLAALAALGSFALTLAPAALAAPVTVQENIKPPPAPTIAITTAFGTGTLSTTPSGSDSSLTFPAVTQSSSSQTVNASDWVEVQASVTNATSGTTWAVYGSGTALTASGGSGAIPASDLTVPGTAGNAWAGTSSGGTYLGSGNASLNGVALSSSSQLLYTDLSPSSQKDLVFQPTLTVPANTPAGSYTGTMDLSASLN